MFFKLLNTDSFRLFMGPYIDRRANFTKTKKHYRNPKNKKFKSGFSERDRDAKPEDDSDVGTRLTQRIFVAGWCIVMRRVYIYV